MTKTLSACLAGLVSILLIGFVPHAAIAQGTPWATMHAGANSFSIPAARQQCLNAAVSVGECDSFAGMLEAKQCQRVAVKDGTNYRWLGGSGGKIFRNKVKALGGSTAAWRCNLPSGRTLDWYAENVTGKSACNNVGEVVLQSVTRLSITAQHSTIRRQEVISTPSALIDVGCPTCCNEEMLYLPGVRAVIETQQSTGRTPPLKLK